VYEAERAERQFNAVEPENRFVARTLEARWNACLAQVEQLRAKAKVERFGPDGVGVSLPSLRVDAFSVELSAQIQKVRKTGLTFAPEAGTERRGA